MWERVKTHECQDCLDGEMVITVHDSSVARLHLASAGPRACFEVGGAHQVVVLGAAPASWCWRLEAPSATEGHRVQWEANARAVPELPRRGQVTTVSSSGGRLIWQAFTLQRRTMQSKKQQRSKHVFFSAPFSANPPSQCEA